MGVFLLQFNIGNILPCSVVRTIHLCSPALRGITYALRMKENTVTSVIADGLYITWSCGRVYNLKQDINQCS